MVTALFCAALPAMAAVSYDDYHTFAEVEGKLKQWSSSPLVSLETIGRSVGGKPIYVVRVASGSNADSRQAIFVGANAAGYHNAGTEAALDLIETLVSRGSNDDLLTSRTFYVAPILNPDAHDALFGKIRVKRSGNASKIDRDVDGLVAEDDFNDLDGDGRITRMRIADAAGSWLAHAEEPRLMIQEDSIQERRGAFRVEKEGYDDDGDGKFNEDPTDGTAVDLNFPQAHQYPKAEAGPWPTSEPEAESLSRWMFMRRNIALAVIYGPANNLIEMPRPVGAGGDLGTQKFKVPADVAEGFGFDPEIEYTLDEIWEQIENEPFIQQNNITKEQVASFLGAGPATKLEDADQTVLSHLAKGYKEKMKENGQDDRPVEQYNRGGVTPWLYYQVGVLAIELDVWGIPKPAKTEEEGDEKKEEPLTVDSLETMSSEDFLALGEEKIAAFLKEIEAPPQYSAEMVKGGQVNPEQMAGMIRQMGGGSGGGASADGDKDEDDAQVKRAREIYAWVDQNVPDAVSDWKAVTLPDGTKAETGGLDPFIQVAPPMSFLQPAVKAHTDWLLDLSTKTAKVEIVSVKSEDLGGGVYRVKAVAANTGFLPTHTKMAERAQSHNPVRLVLATGNSVQLVTGRMAVTTERLEGSTGTLEAEWLVRAKPGTSLTIEVVTENAGHDSRTHKL